MAMASRYRFGDWRRERQLEPWLDDRSARIAARFEVPMLIAALLVIPTIVLEDSDVGQTGETIAVSGHFSEPTYFTLR